MKTMMTIFVAMIAVACVPMTKSQLKRMGHSTTVAITDSSLATQNITNALNGFRLSGYEDLDIASYKASDYTEIDLINDFVPVIIYEVYNDHVTAWWSHLAGIEFSRESIESAPIDGRAISYRSLSSDTSSE